jgi:hypothetical protein
MTFLLKALAYWREIIIFALLVFCLTTVRECSNERADKELAIASRDSSYLMANHYINKYGESVNEVKTLEATVDQLQDENLGHIIDKDKLKDENINLKHLVFRYKGKASKKDTIKISNRDTVYIEKGDTLRGKWFSFDNKWLKLDGITTLDSTRITYNYNVDFTITAYRKFQGLFKPRQLMTNVTFSDPNLVIGEFQGVVVKEPPKKWFETTLAKFLFGVGVGVAITK